MKRIFLLALGACALALNANAMTADEAAMAALYPEHETFFAHELHPVAKTQTVVKSRITSMDVILVMHVSGLNK